MESSEGFLIVGAEGMLGSALYRRLTGAGKTVVRTVVEKPPDAPDEVFLDLSSDVSDWRPPENLSAAFFCAAVTSLDKCRRDPVETARINVRNTLALARLLMSRGVFVVFPSTNLVFDGSTPFVKADAPRSPKTEYGRQKTEVERELLKSELAAVVRFTKILGPGMPLLRNWARAFGDGEKVTAFTDMVFSPAPLSTALAAFASAGEKRMRGILQVSGDRDIPYSQAARRAAERLGAPVSLIIDARAGDVLPDIEHLPANTTLDTARLQSELGIEPPDALAAIDSVVDSMRN